jgi:hypothetical protein
MGSVPGNQVRKDNLLELRQPAMEKMIRTRQNNDR